MIREDARAPRATNGRIHRRRNWSFAIGIVNLSGLSQLSKWVCAGLRNHRGRGA